MLLHSFGVFRAFSKSMVCHSGCHPGSQALVLHTCIHIWPVMYNVLVTDTSSALDTSAGSPIWHLSRGQVTVLG